ncbi:hypothetical protein PG984_009883 [Apiospora sp. TS-2023a]
MVLRCRGGMLVAVVNPASQSTALRDTGSIWTAAAYFMRLSLLDRHEGQQVLTGPNETRGGVLPVYHHDAATVFAVVVEVGALALGVGGALGHALPDAVGGRVVQDFFEALVDAVGALDLVLDAADRDVTAADSGAAAIAFVRHVGAAAPTLAGDGVDLELLASLAAIALLGDVVEAEALARLTAFTLTAGQVGRVSQPRRAAVVLAGGPVGARDHLGRAAESQLGGGLIGQVPSQVGLLRAAATLLGVGVVLVFEGVQAAPAFASGDGVGGEDALWYLLTGFTLVVPFLANLGTRLSSIGEGGGDHHSQSASVQSKADHVAAER